MTAFHQHGLAVLVMPHAPWRIEMHPATASNCAEHLRDSVEVCEALGLPDVPVCWNGRELERLSRYAALALADEITAAAMGAVGDVEPDCVVRA